MESGISQLAGNVSLQMWVNTAAIIILGLLFVYRTWRGESQKIDDATIASLKRQAETFQNELNVYKTQVLDLTEKVGKQNGIIETQKETIQRYEKIFANRNPELMDLLGQIRDYMKRSDETLAKMTGEMALQTSMLTRNEERIKVASKVT